jgi:hypothetical protein
MESLDNHIKTRVKLEAFDTKLLTEACKSLIAASRVGPPAVLSLHALGAQTAQPVLPRGRDFGVRPGMSVIRGVVPVCEGFPKTRAPSAVRLGVRVGLRLCGLGEWLPVG